VQDCLEREDQFNGFNEVRDHNEGLVDWIFQVMQPQARIFKEEKLNFADYMFLRKTHLAWRKCSSDNRLTYKSMDCAIYVVVP